MTTARTLSPSLKRACATQIAAKSSPNPKCLSSKKITSSGFFRARQALLPKNERQKTSPLDSYEYTRVALARTHRWAERCLAQHAKTRREYQSLWGIVQGGAYRDLREESARFIGALPFEGLCIGGSLGKSKKEMHAILEWTIPLLPENKPRHLLGIGEIPDIIAGIARGVDLFDCASPTRWARNGALIVSREMAENPEQRLNISNARYALDRAPIDPTCDCYTCQHFSRAYLHHLHRAKELTYYRLATIHNLRMMVRLMCDLRAHIRAGTFSAEMFTQKAKIFPSTKDTNEHEEK